MLGLGRMSLTTEDLNALRSEFPTRQDLTRELERFATKEDLKRFATKEDLEPFATKEDLSREIGKLREETAQSSADLRRYMEILIEDLWTKCKGMFDGLAARIDAGNRRYASQLANHESRLGSLEGRTTALEKRQSKRR